MGGRAPQPFPPIENFYFPVFCSYTVLLFNKENGMKVEKGIPAPAPREVVEYPYDDMEVGDSFFVEGGTLNKLCYQNRKAGIRLDAKFTVRKVEGGVRVWRLA